MKNKIIIGAILTIVNIPISLFLTMIIHLKLTNVEMIINIDRFKEIVIDKQYLMLFLFVFLLFEIMVIVVSCMNNKNVFESSVGKITSKIKTPVAIGQGQHGTSRWMKKEEFAKSFKKNIVPITKTKKNKIHFKLLDKYKKKKQYVYKSGGLIVGYKKKRKEEEIYYIEDNIHSITVGATRSGKTRSVVLQTIGNLALAGESMIISDPKAELFHYTSSYLESLGYKVITLDFKNPLKSSRYNFLQPVIDAVNRNDYIKAEEYAWDITTSLVGNEESKMEKIWKDGEMSVIAGAIMTVVFDNKQNPSFQNLTNVYAFISEMCKTVGNTMPINKYIENLSPEHPASSIFGIARIAPEKTRRKFLYISINNT